MYTAAGASLHEQLSARRAELAEVRHEVDLARRRARSASAAQARHRKLTDTALRVALIIYTLARGDTEPAVVFLRAQGRKRGWPPKEDDEIADVAVWAFIEAEDTFLVDLTDVDAPSDAEAMRVALDYVEQWRVSREALEHNVARGVAPGSASMFQRFEARRQELLEAVRPYARGLSAQAKGRSFMKRFRRRWGGRYGALRVREQVPLQLLQSKARWLGGLSGGEEGGLGRSACLLVGWLAGYLTGWLTG